MFTIFSDSGGTYLALPDIYPDSVPLTAGFCVVSELSGFRL